MAISKSHIYIYIYYKLCILISCIVLFPSLVSASDVLVWQGQYYTGTTFNTGTYEFNFSVYDTLTGGNICYSNTTTLTTGNWGEWKTEQSGVNSACNNVSKDYYLNINIAGTDQTPRRRLTIFNFLRKDVDEITTGNITTTQTGFFSWLGSLTSRITKLFVQNIDFSGNINGTGNITTTGFGRFAYIDKVEQATAPATPSADTLRLYVEDINGFSFFSFIDDTGMTRKIVRDSIFVGKGSVVGGIGIGQVVYACGSSGNRPKLCLANANSTTTMPAIGIAIENIAKDDFGRVMQVGLLEKFNTNLWAEGEILYVSDTQSGNMTTTLPLVPSLKQEIGTVLVKHQTQGQMQIISRSVQQDETGSAQNIWKLGDGLAGTKKIIINNGFLGNLSWTPTANREITIPDASGTMGVGTGSANKAVCWKTATTLGYCSSTVNATGDCTCN